MMKCIYGVEAITSGQTHSRTKWQEAITRSGMILPLIPTGENAVLDRQDDLYVVKAGHGGETIAITNDANTAIGRARKADGRKPLAYINDLGELVITDKETESADLARFAKLSPEFIYYVHYYNTRDLKLIGISYESSDGLVKSDKPIVVEGVDKALDEMDKIAKRVVSDKATRQVVAWSIKRYFDVDDDSDICNVPAVPDDIKKALAKAIKDEAKKIRNERKKEKI